MVTCYCNNTTFFFKHHILRVVPGRCYSATRRDRYDSCVLRCYGAEFGVVFLAKGPRTASIQEGLDCLGLDHSGLEGERDFRLVVELP